MSGIAHVPLPYFIIDKAFIIMDRSKEAVETFSAASGFMELVDEESRRKAGKTLLRAIQGETELNLKTKKEPLAAYKIKFNWVDGAGHLLCIPQDEHILHLQEKVESHRRRLAETDLELLVKKEELENSLKKIIELSGPFIKLSDEMVLLPLFGPLNEQLIMKNKERFLQGFYESSYDVAIIDFNGIGEVFESGILALKNFLNELELMGIKPILAGLNPSHTFAINKTGLLLNVEFIANLGEALKLYFPQRL